MTDRLIATVTSSLADESNTDNNYDKDRDFVLHTAITKTIVEPKKEYIAEVARRVLMLIYKQKNIQFFRTQIKLNYF